MVRHGAAAPPAPARRARSGTSRAACPLLRKQFRTARRFRSMNVRHGLRVRERRNAADRVAGAVRTNAASALPIGFAGERRDLRLVHAMRAARDHEHGRARRGAEHERLRDLADRAARAPPRPRPTCARARRTRRSGRRRPPRSAHPGRAAPTATESVRPCAHGARNSSSTSSSHSVPLPCSIAPISMRSALGATGRLIV